MIKISSYASLLLEADMPIAKAYALFRSRGIDNIESISLEDATKAWKSVLKKIHTDVSTSSSTRDVQEWNDAFDSISKAKSQKSTSSPIVSLNKKDINYYKEKAWEISGKPAPTKENLYTFWNWDGMYFRGSFSVYTTPKHWFEVSELLVEWDNFYRSVAVFVSDKNDPTLVYLVSHKGKPVIPPMEYGHNSFNKNPGNDTKFTDLLRKVL